MIEPASSLYPSLFRAQESFLVSSSENAKVSNMASPSVSIALIGKSYFLSAGGRNLAYEYVMPYSLFHKAFPHSDLMVVTI